MSPNLSYSITGTFNLFVKDRLAFRLSGAPSVQNRSRTNANLSVLETFQNYRLRRIAVNPKESQDFHNFCTVVRTRLRSRRRAGNGARATRWRTTKRVFRLENRPIFRHEPRRKRSNLEKDHLEVLAMTLKPFEEPCPRMQTPWPGLNS